MGRRSRKRGESTRAERDAARQERAAAPRTPVRRRSSERPPAPWGGFPLSELIILAGIALILWGAARGSGGEEMLAAGLVLASLGLGPVRLWLLLLLGVAVFGATFYAMRELFKRRSGGLGFR